MQKKLKNYEVEKQERRGFQCLLAYPESIFKRPANRLENTYRPRKSVLLRRGIGHPLYHSTAYWVEANKTQREHPAIHRGTVLTLIAGKGGSLQKLDAECCPLSRRTLLQRQFSLVIILYDSFR